MARVRGLHFIETRRARKLHRDETRAENVMWDMLQNRRLGGHKVVRQLPVGPYFADFACRSLKLIIEIDGNTHVTTEDIARDKRRTAFLNQQGYHVIRFTNDDVFDVHLDLRGPILSVLDDLKRQRGQSPGPSPHLSP